MTEMFSSDEEMLEATALAMRRQADAALDGVTGGGTDYSVAPRHWAYLMLGMAAFMESEARTLNLRTRAFSLAAARAFWGEQLTTWLEVLGEEGGL